MMQKIAICAPSHKFVGLDVPVLDAPVLGVPVLDAPVQVYLYLYLCFDTVGWVI